MNAETIIKNLLKTYISGENYETKNPYCREEVKQGLQYLAKKQGVKDYLDVKLD